MLVQFDGLMSVISKENRRHEQQSLVWHRADLLRSASHPKHSCPCHQPVLRLRILEMRISWESPFHSVASMPGAPASLAALHRFPLNEEHPL
jgi:hypothetical protein